MKKEYTIIVLLLLWTMVMIVKPIIESLPTPEEKEYREYMAKMSEESLAV